MPDEPAPDHERSEHTRAGAPRLTDADIRDLVRSVRAASGPKPDDDAARRVADAAWAEGRRSPATRRPSVALRRFGLVAAAALVAAVGVVALQPTEQAFAVDGDPVQVWHANRWEESHSVAPGVTVFVPAGARRLRGSGGAEIVPEPGASFRIARGDAHGSFRVELLRGAAEVAGDHLRLVLSDLEVVPVESGLYRAFAALATQSGGAPTDTAPEGPPRASRTALASVRMSIGSAILTCGSTGQRMDLGGSDAVALVPFQGGAGGLRLCRVSDFSPDVPMKIAAGQPVIAFQTLGDGGLALLEGADGRVSPVAVRGRELDTALDAMNRAMQVFVARLGSDSAAPCIEAPATAMVLGDGSIDDHAERTGTTISTVTMEQNGRRVRIVVQEDGGVTVESDTTLRTYPNLDAAQVVEGDTIAALLPYLKN